MVYNNNNDNDNDDNDNLPLQEWIMYCPPGPNKVTIIEGWPLVEVWLYEWSIHRQ